MLVPRRGDAARTRIASAAFASPWNDIPLHRLLLSLQLDGKPPAAADWSVAPGSPEGVRLYKDFAELLKRWADATPEPRTAIDRAMECELAMIVPGHAEVGKSISVDDAVAILDAAVANDGYRTERSLAHALLALCHSLSDDSMIVAHTGVTPREHDGPIDYFTSGLEGFDELAAVKVVDEGRSLWCRFASGWCYRIPIEYLRKWLEIEENDTMAKARRLSGGSDVQLRLQSGQTVSLSANAILRYCEPLYTDASPRTPFERQLLDAAGSFRQAC